MSDKRPKTNEEMVKHLTKELVQAQARNAIRPEHIEHTFVVFTKWIQEEVDVSREEWIEVFETLQTKVEFEEVEWL